MAKKQPKHDVIEGMKGSEQHHPLKNQPGEKGDSDHMDTKAKEDQGEGKDKD
ncbi:hypothetical protein GS634_22045 [Ruegeria atlantica]|uniref:Uncharacterized protein n=1 Tax=Ruegeria atlantica TaxID=81569 RepID=A0AA90YWL6_9RHOB|nr:hypothetical protein [Ruegeria atlantica]NOE20821.1 hypothetical protein [Ruegeria atlantica]